MKNLNIILIGCLLFSATGASAQYIHTIAGNGAGVYGGDGGAATLASLDAPYGVAADAAGNVYITEYYSSHVRKVSVSGIISTIAGNGSAGYGGDGGPATLATLANPTGIAVDAAGNVYFADAGNSRLRKITPSGMISLVAGTGGSAGSPLGDGGPATAGRLYMPQQVAIDRIGNIYIADQYNNLVRKIDTSGIISSVASITGATGIGVDAAGNLYTSEYHGNIVRKISTTGLVTTIAGNGTDGFSGDGFAATAAEMSSPASVAVDSIGNIYFADNDNSRVRKIDASGIISTVAGDGSFAYADDDVPAVSTGMNPEGLFISNSGIMYIVDAYNNRVREVNSHHSTLSVLGAGTGAPAGMTIYPNPNNGRFTISIGAATDEAATIVITNVTGSKVKEISAKANEQVDVVLDAPAGVYFVFAQTASGRWCEKIVNQPK